MVSVMSSLVMSRCLIFWDLEIGKIRNWQTRANEITELRIHEHTERGDNDTIKMPNGKKVVIDGKKCSEK